MAALEYSHLRGACAQAGASRAGAAQREMITRTPLPILALDAAAATDLCGDSAAAAQGPSHGQCAP